jgi:hypothetical protein
LFLPLLFVFQKFKEKRRNQVLIYNSLVVINIFRDSGWRAFDTSSFMVVAEVEPGERSLKNLWHQKNNREKLKWWNIARDNKLFR